MNKILLVDDSGTMRKILMRVLRQAEIDCDGFLEASNGAEGLEFLNSEPGVSLVLCDFNMPVMNGLEFVKSVRAIEARKTLPIVMVTTEGGAEMVKNAMDAGASGYVTKPFTPESIKTALVALGK